MPNGTTQDTRISPPGATFPGFWGYLVDKDSGQRILYWDKDNLIPEKIGRKILPVEYKLEETSLYTKKEQKLGDIQMAIITHFDPEEQI